MKKNIGILFPSSRKLGVFQYALSIGEGFLNYYPDHYNYSILYFDAENPREFFTAKNLKNVKFISLDGRVNNFRGKTKLLLNTLREKPFFTVNKHNRKILENSKIDLAIVPFPLLFGSEYKIPYIVAIPDIMYKYYPGFPEYRFLDRLKNNLVYKYSARSALLNVVDSQQGLEDLHKFFKIPKKKIRIIPYIPPGYVYKYKDMDESSVDILLKKYNLPEKFLFYPAQFWYHKNHLRLIKAMAFLRQNLDLEASLILVGSSKANYENYQKVMNLAKELKIEKQISHLGYVSDKEIVALYKKSWALVFPTLIGPTSIPPLEAMVLGTAVLCSNLFSMPEQIEKAGLFFDPFSVKDMAEKIHKIWINEELREELVQKGYERAGNMTLENYVEQWGKLIEEAINRFKI